MKACQFTAGSVYSPGRSTFKTDSEDSTAASAAAPAAPKRAWSFVSRFRELFPQMGGIAVAEARYSPRSSCSEGGRPNETRDCSVSRDREVVLEAVI